MLSEMTIETAHLVITSKRQVISKAPGEFVKYTAEL